MRQTEVFPSPVFSARISNWPRGQSDQLHPLVSLITSRAREILEFVGAQLTITVLVEPLRHIRRIGRIEGPGMGEGWHLAVRRVNDLGFGRDPDVRMRQRWACEAERGDGQDQT